ncbi:MAG: hypothetical protein IJN57_02390 [Oscillospiraceae bacterium]|nr:hypothetical protein [Oscillospiraceae bacterium]
MAKLMYENEVDGDGFPECKDQTSTMQLSFSEVREHNYIFDTVLVGDGTMMKFCYNEEQDQLYAFEVNPETGEAAENVTVHAIFDQELELEKGTYTIELEGDTFAVTKEEQSVLKGGSVSALVSGRDANKMVLKNNVEAGKEYLAENQSADAVTDAPAAEAQTDAPAAETPQATEETFATLSVEQSPTETAAAGDEGGGSPVLVILLIVAAVAALLACGAAAVFAVMFKKARSETDMLKKKVRALQNESSSKTMLIDEAKANRHQSEGAIETLESENNELRAMNQQLMQNEKAWEQKLNDMHADATQKLEEKDAQLAKMRSTAEAWKEYAEKWRNYSDQLKQYSDRMEGNVQQLVQRLINYEQVNAELLASQAPAAPDAPEQTEQTAPAAEPEFTPEPEETLEDRALRISLDLDEVDRYPEAVFLNVANMMTGEVRLSAASSYRTAPIVLIGRYLYLNPYFFVDLPKRRESVNNLRSVEAIYEISGLGGGNLPYGLDYISPAQATDIDGKSFRLDSKGRMTVSA